MVISSSWWIIVWIWEGIWLWLSQTTFEKGSSNGTPAYSEKSADRGYGSDIICPLKKSGINVKGWSSSIAIMYGLDHKQMPMV
jgi:hypothetical protein